MIGRILLAVDDSLPAFGAARYAVDLATALRAEVRAVHVVQNHAVTEALDKVSARTGVARRRDISAGNVLEQVSRQAAAAGVPARTLLLSGEPAARILAEARTWPADLVVLGGSDDAHVGHVARTVLEFAEQPVLVVPRGG